LFSQVAKEDTKPEKVKPKKKDSPKIDVMIVDVDEEPVKVAAPKSPVNNVDTSMDVEEQQQIDDHDWENRPDYSQFDFVPNLRTAQENEEQLVVDQILPAAAIEETKPVTGNVFWVALSDFLTDVDLDAKSLIKNSFSLFSTPAVYNLQPSKPRRKVFLDDLPKSQDELFPLNMESYSTMETSHKSRCTANIPNPPSLNSIRNVTSDIIASPPSPTHVQSAPVEINLVSPIVQKTAPKVIHKPSPTIVPITSPVQNPPVIQKTIPATATKVSETTSSPPSSGPNVTQVKPAILASITSPTANVGNGKTSSYFSSSGSPSLLNPAIAKSLKVPTHEKPPTSPPVPTHEKPLLTKKSPKPATTPAVVDPLPPTPEKKKSSPEKKFHSGFTVLMNRPEQPPNKGKKDLPVGQAGCLEGLSFIITGVLDSLEREEASKLITDYGG
jgi:hypothetical protein